MPIEPDAAAGLSLRNDAAELKSDRSSIPSGEEYTLALRFNRKRRGLAAFDWVAVWRTSRGKDSRAFPLDAHGFDEALRGAAATILMETGLPVTQTDLEIAGYKQHRVTVYMRELPLQEASSANQSADGAGQDSALVTGAES